MMEYSSVAIHRCELHDDVAGSRLAVGAEGATAAGESVIPGIKVADQ
jgi:hypothetical protein